MGEGIIMNIGGKKIKISRKIDKCCNKRDLGQIRDRKVDLNNENTNIKAIIHKDRDRMRKIV
jgi:hypothetical protein